MWTSPLVATTNVASYAQHTHDDSNNVYAVNSTGTGIVVYNITTNALSSKTASFGTTSEPRIAWDSASHLLYVAPYYFGTSFYSFDPTTSTQVTLTSIPDTIMSDVFCSDRSGHIYAGGTYTAAQMWQYTVSTKTWAKLSAVPPFSNGNVGACTVTADGWLYYSNGSNVAKLQLL